MDLFTFVAWVAVLIAAVTVIWPLNVPLLALAVKVRRGAEPTGYEPSELWWRCALGSLGLAVLTLILLGLTYGVVVEAEFAAARGPVHLVLILLYVTAAIPYLFWTLALEDMFQAASVFLLYVFLPGLVLFLLGWLLGWGGLVSAWAPWLL
ncbi:MAG TPA: hypothetical protein VJ739_15335 [Gemmataceae bacterium]|nr:hypothetical protein [Gemmataceae bacterium]